MSTTAQPGESRGDPGDQVQPGQSWGADDFLRQANPLRRELLAHCYRMLGSLHDAEDLVQETYLRAWRAYDRFEGRSSLRTWLHRIATRTCLTALEGRGRRPLPTGLGRPGSDPTEAPVDLPEVPWLEPVPDTAIDVDQADPAAVVTARESIRLAFVAAMQFLPPRQRAVLILRDVLRWRAAEVAEALDTTTAAVNSMLQRARAQLDQAAPSRDAVSEPTAAHERELLDRYVAAFEAKDIPAIVALFTADAVWEMPPFADWYRGPDQIGTLVDTQCPARGPGDLRLIPCRANGQPAFGLYLRAEDGGHRPFCLHVLTVTGAGVSHVVSFFTPELFPRFGLPEHLPAAGTGADRAAPAAPSLTPLTPLTPLVRAC
ncbi:sigma-70 family RNA polymerase sigma factor [Goodfellowiella coeruleoviolacea]|uniref:RNA polymerase sigma factor n=1 Tax=Goodfellowiella coeruleoviolacea TaxID=334858 RepID=A0AAE3GIX5_9PSEU|nr:sigma-70 family RNA polymerase sigma factor [Goodfellowiella coeruleoviolacea]MCP2169051.1 RNA polymerase sigma-70 factor, ECF subfamily [Goodfellowiella coeruleoviolacea]